MLQFGGKAGLVIPPSAFTQEELLSKLSRWAEPREADLKFTDMEKALFTASKLFPEGFRKRLVLITDGNENRGDVSSLFDELKAMDITVDVLPIGGVGHDEVFVGYIHAPAQVRVGNPFIFEVSVSSNAETDGRLRITVDGEDIILKDNFSILPGNHLYRFPLIFDKGGFHEISVRLTAKHDTIFLNNSAETTSFAAGSPNVLIITDPSSDNNYSRKYLGNILINNNIDTEYMPANLMPADSKKYISYDAVILDNISSRLLSPQQMKALSKAVHDIGTGLVLIGGDKSTGLNGFANTPIESALPVSLIPSTGERPSSLDLVFVMDKSGSMSEGGADSSIRLAADAVQSIIDMSGEEDKIGIIAFDSRSHVITSPGSIRNREEIAKKIENIKPSGSTDLYPAMTLAYDWLKVSDASHKHIILLSDGKTRERDFSELMSMIREKEITISTISIGMESNVPLMKKIAHMGEGRFFQVEDDLHELSTIFQIDTMMASKALIVEDSFSPRLNEPDMILNGMPLKIPEMHGYMVTSPKKTAIIPVISHLGDPVIGFWNYGLGRSVIFTGDDGSKWSGDWIKWEGFGRLLVQMAKRSMRPGTGQENIPVFRVDGNNVKIQYEISKKRGEMPMNILVKILSPDGETSDTKLLRAYGKLYSGAINGLAPGKFVAVITEERKGVIEDLSRGSFLIRGSEEFLTLDRNDKLLKDIAARTGGRVLTDKDTLFNESEKKTGRSIPAWPYLFLAAAMLFLAYVAIQKKVNPFIQKSK